MFAHWTFFKQCLSLPKKDSRFGDSRDMNNRDTDFKDMDSRDRDFKDLDSRDREP